MAKAEKLGDDVKAKAEQQLTALRQKRDAVSEKLKDLSSSIGNAWEQVKSGTVIGRLSTTSTSCKRLPGMARCA
ncbi:MAG: hypothetical protein P8012_05490 [Desulfobacterales bacterium]